MNNDSPSPAESTPAQDRATETLLREYGRLQSNDDEDFLAAFEQRLAKEAEPETAPMMARAAAPSSQKKPMQRRIFHFAALAAAACVLVTVAWHLGQSQKPAQTPAVAQKLPASPDAKAKGNANVSASPANPLAAGKETTPPNSAALSATPKPSVAVLSPIIVKDSSNLLVSAPPSNVMNRFKGVDLKSELGLISAGSEIFDGSGGARTTLLQSSGATYDYQPPTESSLEVEAGGFAMTGTLKADASSSPLLRSLDHTDQAPKATGANSASAFEPGSAMGVFGGAVLPSSTPSNFTGDLTISSGAASTSSLTDFTTFSGVVSGAESSRLASATNEFVPTTGRRFGGGSSTLAASSADAYTGTATITAGTLVVPTNPASPPPPSGPSAPSPVQLQGLGYIASTGSTFTGGTTINAGKLVSDSGKTTFTNNGSTTVTSTVTASGALTKVGASTLTLNDGNLTFTGGNSPSFGNSTVTLGNAAATAVPGLRLSTPADNVSAGNRYDAAPVNPFLSALSHPLSTFSIDVDTASYANIRRLIQSGAGVPPAAVRLEEMINYFPYTYVEPKGEHPIAVKVESAACPWAPSHRLVKIALKAKEIDRNRRAAANLVFLVDVSGSMSSEDKLALVIKNLRVLTASLNADDTVSIVTYAGNSGIALPPTLGDKKQKILDTLASLNAGGSTNGAGGIIQAYELAKKQFIKEGVNRVVLCTDGDFNVGITGKQSLVDLVKERAQDGIFLTVCGYGQGNLNAAMLEAITDKGNGIYHYIDSEREGRKVFQDELFGTLVTVAKDVKLQVEFNPAHAAQYRLIGYDNRMLAKEDFANDKVDAGDIGAGHRVTALYEVIPTGSASVSEIPLKYQATPPAPEPPKSSSPELLTVKLRYKEPAENTSKLFDQPFTDDPKATASTDFAFAAVVAEFGNWLRGERAEGRTLAQLIEAAEAARGDDPHGYRSEFIELMKRVK
ncbi:MAG: von Willebrand factor type A domain-containing protein [Verrucomicrobiaceae bacterium]|nr:von Willebrand factor type A domain-containing protein [Verrucomicrobiaceae bacterium]